MIKARPATPGQYRCSWVVGWQDYRLPGLQARTDRPGNHHGRHACLRPSQPTEPVARSLLPSTTGKSSRLVNRRRTGSAFYLVPQAMLHTPAGIYFSLAAALRIAVARFACLVRDMFAACPESEDSRRDPLEEWHSRPKILRIKVWKRVKTAADLRGYIFCSPDRR